MSASLRDVGIYRPRLRRASLTVGGVLRICPSAKPNIIPSKDGISHSQLLTLRASWRCVYSRYICSLGQSEQTFLVLMLAFGMGASLPTKILHFPTFDQSHGFCEKSCTTQNDAIYEARRISHYEPPLCLKGRNSSLSDGSSR
jgi:hypothetical protein